MSLLRLNLKTIEMCKTIIFKKWFPASQLCEIALIRLSLSSFVVWRKYDTGVGPAGEQKESSILNINIDPF